MKVMIYLRSLLYFLMAVLVIFCISSVAILFVTLDDKPLVFNVAKPDPQSLISSKKQIKRLVRELKTTSSHKSISFTHPQLDHLTSFVSHNTPSLSAIYNYSGLDLLLAASIKLPENPFGAYLNISIEFNDGSNVFNGTTRVGPLTFSNTFIFNFAFSAASLTLDSELVASVRYLFDKTTYTEDTVDLIIGPEVQTEILLGKIKTDLKKVIKLVWNNDQYSEVSYYYDYLINLSRHAEGLDKVSLFDYMKPLFAEAKAQSVVNDPADENSNALIALALFVGDYNLRRGLSQITNNSISELQRTPKVILANRRDLMLHFIYSSTIKILSYKGLSLSIGELKEVIDMEKGGSGFSFADLAADRAGVKFAIMATDKNGGALHLQNFMAKANSERGFVPDLFALPEGISLSEFNRDYQNTDSAEYRAVVNEIDRRIQDLPLFRNYR